MFEGPIVTTVEIDQDRHDVTQGQRRLAGANALPRLEQRPLGDRFKGLAEIIDSVAHRHELQLAHRDLLCGVDSWLHQQPWAGSVFLSTISLIPNSR